MSTQFRFTQRALQQLPPHSPSSASRAAEYSDTEISGLKALVNKQRRISFYFRYVFAGQKRAMKLGAYPALDITDARKRAHELRTMLDRGIDPQAETPAPAAPPLTFADFAQSHYLPYAYAHKRSARDDESRLRIHVLPRFGLKALTEIHPRDIQWLHAELKQSHCPATANRVLSVISKLFKLAQQWGMVSHTPCAAVTKFQENNQQQRFLTPEEIQRMYLAMEEERNQTAVSALKLLLLTGVRREEALQARWQDLDLEQALWWLPHTKSGKSRYVQLNPAALNVLRSQAKIEGIPWVFPGRNPEHPLNNPTKAFHRILKMAKIERLRIHDLRHSFASLAVNAGVSLFQVQKLLHHASAATTQRYAHLADDTLRMATATVGEVVMRAVEGER